MRKNTFEHSYGNVGSGCQQTIVEPLLDTTTLCSSDLEHKQAAIAVESRSVVSNLDLEYGELANKAEFEKLSSFIGLSHLFGRTDRFTFMPKL